MPSVARFRGSSVTATRKVLIAIVLLVVGYGVARFVGGSSTPWAASAGGAAELTVPAQAPVQSAQVEATPLVPTGTRLVPDFGTENPYRQQITAESGSPPVFDTATKSLVGPAALTVPAIQPSAPSGLPVARLRDEAPRPLDLDARQPLPMPQSPSMPYAVTSPPESTLKPEEAWQLRPVLPAGFAENPQTSAANASYAEPALPQNATTFPPASFSAPPTAWPEPSKFLGLRTHVVIDGDSLERLANRYLDDPSRGVEIYEANRELLSSPELLPIGAELVIPEPQSRSAMEGVMPQSSLANDPSLRAAAYRGMVPVRTIPDATNTMPRAQLLPPQPAE